MKKYNFAVLCILIFLLLKSHCYSQSANIFGTVKESLTGEAVVGAAVVDKRSGQRAVSNRQGFFNLRLDIPFESQLEVSQLGYTTKIIPLKINGDTLLNIDLELHELSEVVVTTSVLDRNPISTVSIPVKRLTKLPMVLGEPDIFKALALLPGISTGIEGSAGLYVRGGTPDQNLILLDDTPVYNPSHLFGFFSVFHPDMVKDVELIKGGFPAKYGGRLSSIIDVRMKDGNKEKFEGEASLGLINSRISLEGPLGKDKNTSFHLGGRISYLGALMKPVLALANSDENISYVMHDWNGKLHHIIDDKNELFFSYYFGRDNYEGREGTRRDYESFGLNWGNQTATLRYKKIFSPVLFSNFSAWYTEYHHEIDSRTVSENENGDLNNGFFRSWSGLRDLSAKADFEWLPHKDHEVNFGSELNLHGYAPGHFSSSFTTDSTRTDPGFQKASELAFYLDDKWTIGDSFSFIPGIRLSSFITSGKSYHAFEPRIAGSLEIDDNTSLRLSYSRMRQYIHMLSSNGVGLPNDIWVPSTDLVEPQNSRQWTLGVSRDIVPMNLKATVEGYYKSSDNLIESVPGTNYLFIRDNNWENFIYRDGSGRSYGMEALLEVQKGRTNGWLSYTLSKNLRKFETLNSGEWYPSRYDRRHNISLVVNHRLNDNWEINANWVYSSGHPVTLPVAVIKDPEGSLFPVFSERNNQKMPDYHRLDVGFSHHWLGEKQRNKRITFGVYNLYNRINPLYLDYAVPFFLENVDIHKIKITRKGGIPILPYFTYSLTF